MKIFLLILCMFSISYAKVYYAKVEPFELREISSKVSGLVVYADENFIGKRLTAKPYIQMDFEIDQKDLKSTKEKLTYVKSVLEINEAILVNLDESLGKKRENYKKVEPLKFKSVVEKDKEFYDLIASENLYLSTRKEIQNLKIQISDLKFREAQLERSISDKNLVAENFILYEMLVKPGQV
ncbi:MAG: HlyD family secretion protein, partial [Campylobacterota bacterium]